MSNHPTYETYGKEVEPELDKTHRTTLFANAVLNLPHIPPNAPIGDWIERLKYYISKTIEFKQPITNGSLYAYLGVNDKQLSEWAGGIGCSNELSIFAQKCIALCRAARENMAVAGDISPAIGKTLLSHYDGVSDSSTINVQVGNQLEAPQTPEELAMKYIQALPMVEIDESEESEDEF